jgi:hypothetical protein
VLRFQPTESNRGLYCGSCSEDRGGALLAYVDDIIVAARAIAGIEEVIKGLGRKVREVKQKWTGMHHKTGSCFTMTSQPKGCHAEQPYGLWRRCGGGACSVRCASPHLFFFGPSPHLLRLRFIRQILRPSGAVTVFRQRSHRCPEPPARRSARPCPRAFTSALYQ